MAFALSGPTAISIKQGESASATYQAIRTSKPYRQVSFSVLGLPSGITGSFSPVSGTPTVTTTLRLTASPTSAVGNFPIQVRARDAKSTKTIEVILSNYLNRPVDPPAGEIFDFYISPTGNDANTGTGTGDSQAWLTIQKACNTLTAGQSCGVLPGVYVTTAIITSGNNGSSGNLIRFVSTTQYGAIIRPNGTFTRAWNNSGNFVEINGFDIDGVNNTTANIPILNSGNTFKFTRNKAHDFTMSNGGANLATNGGGGIVNQSSAHTVEISSNQLYNIGLSALAAQPTQPGVHCIYHQQSGGGQSNIFGNTVHDVDDFSASGKGTGILLYPNSHSTNTYGNRVYNCKIGIRPLTGTHDVYNNIVFECGLEAIRWEVSGSNCINNTLTGTTADDLELVSGADNNLVKNNIVWPGSIINSGAGNTLTTNIQTDPTFVNSATDDYHIQSTSNCRNTGTDASAQGVTDDYDGNARPLGAGWDVGAYEFVE